MVITAVRFFLVWVLASLVAVPVACGLVLLLPFRVARIRLLNGAGKFTANGVMTLLGVQGTLTGREHLRDLGPAIYVANHSSALDTVVIPWVGISRATYVLKREAIFIPVLGQALWMGGHVFIDRSSPKKAFQTLKGLASFAVERELGIWIMPEGTRSKTGELGRFKRGFVRLALETGYPVVPIAIRGADRVWPNGTWRLRPGMVDIHVLAPVVTEDWRGETAQEHVDFVRQLIENVLAR